MLSYIIILAKCAKCCILGNVHVLHDVVVIVENNPIETDNPTNHG